MVWGRIIRYAGDRATAGWKADAQWCFEPVRQSGLDIAAYPKLLPPSWVSTRSRLFPSSMSPGSTPFFKEIAMDIIYSNVAGLDLHLKSVVTDLRLVQPTRTVLEEIRTFGTMTRDLLELADWMAAHGVTHVAMEATGVLWKPVWNILEARGFKLLLVNPHDLKKVPGRKSDVKDCQWIAQLLQCGLLRNSFVPPRPQRELRDLTRHRAQLSDEHTRVANRIHKTLEDANIKLGSVASDLLGKSGRAMLRALVAGERDSRRIAELAEGNLRKKIPELTLALQGHFTDHHRFMVERLLDHLDYLEKQIDKFSERIEECLRPMLPDAKLERLDEIVGVNRRTIENVIAEIGVNMDQFPTEQNLSSWGGLSPGNEESAGKRIRSRTKKGNRWLRRALCESAWAARGSKRSYFASQYRRLAGRRGKKRAILAVAHSILVIFYHMLKDDNREYKDLGPDYFDRLAPERLKRSLVKRLQKLGYQVTLAPNETAA
jgi:transposase